MDEAPPETPAARSRLGWTLTACGVLLILWSVLGLASAGYGSQPAREFAARRSYNMVKRDVHRGFPLAALRGISGLTLLILGARARR